MKKTKRVSKMRDADSTCKRHRAQRRKTERACYDCRSDADSEAYADASRARELMDRLDKAAIERAAQYLDSESPLCEFENCYTFALKLELARDRFLKVDIGKHRATVLREDKENKG